MKKKKSKNVSNSRSNPFIIGLITVFFDIIKHFVKDFDNLHKIKKIDKYDEQFSTLEHLIIKMNAKLNDYRHEIEEQKSRILWGNIIIIVLLLVNLIMIIK